MYKLITHLVVLIAAFVLFTAFTQPTFEQAKAVEQEISDYELAIDKADQLIARVEELINQRNRFSTSDLERLESFLPDYIDEVGTVLSLDALSSKHRLLFGDIAVAKVVSESSEEDDTDRDVRQQKKLLTKIDVNAFDENPEVKQSKTASSDQYAKLAITFTAVGEYNDFRQFLSEMESSLSLMDISVLGVTEADKEVGAQTFQVTVHIYEFDSKTY